MNFDSGPDPDPAFHPDADPDPDPASQNDPQHFPPPLTILLNPTDKLAGL